MMNKKNPRCLLLLIIAFFSAGSAWATVKDEVVKRGYLQCGVSTGIPGFSSVDEKGNWSGFDVDVCRGVAAATLGDAGKVKFMPLADDESFTALLSGEVDVLNRNATWTFGRDSALAVHFAGISYYDGQGLLVAGPLNAKRISDLKKVNICSRVGSDMEENLVNYFTRNRVEFKVIPFENPDLAVKGFEAGKCDVITMHQSMLYGLRLGLADPETAVVLPDVISKEPLGPVVRQGDDTWFDIVKWSLYAMVAAEELGINSANVEEKKVSDRLAVKRLLGQDGNVGKGLGLNDDCFYQIIRQVGNYGEVFDRNFGSKSVLKMERGLNNLWNQGGLQYAPPLR